MLTLLAGSLSLVPQLAVQQRVAAPLAARRLAVSPQAALTTDERAVPREVSLCPCSLTQTLFHDADADRGTGTSTEAGTDAESPSLTRCSSVTLSMRPRC